MFQIDIPQLITGLGYAGVAFTVFAESGLLFGFFLPGDSLLFTAGFLASQDILNVWILIPLVFVSAVVGDSVGYEIGRKFGPRVFRKEDSLLFKKEYVTRTRDYFTLHGGKTIILARFVPIIRSFAPVMAGVGSMPYRTFLKFNLIGGLLWAVGLCLGGYYMGKFIPNADHYILPIIILIIIISLLPHAITFWKSRKR